MAGGLVPVGNTTDRHKTTATKVAEWRGRSVVLPTGECFTMAQDHLPEQTFQTR